MKIVQLAVIFLQCLYGLLVVVNVSSAASPNSIVKQSVPAVLTPVAAADDVADDADDIIPAFVSPSRSYYVPVEIDDDVDSVLDSLRSTPTADKRTMGMLRMGRAMGMLRMGRRAETDDDQLTPADKRAMGMLRMGRRAMGMLRMGRRSMDDEKRAMGMLRMGRSSLDEEQPDVDEQAKRSMGMLRMGRSAGDKSKKSMSMLRMG
jgi:hypothetical protein